MSDARFHFNAARDVLIADIQAADAREIAARDELDQVIGERTRLRAVLTDLEQLLADLDQQHKNPSTGELTAVKVQAEIPMSTELSAELDQLHDDDPTRSTTSAAPRARGGSRSMLAAAAVRVPCPDCGLEFSQMGLGPHRSKKHGTTSRVLLDTVVKPSEAPGVSVSRTRAGGIDLVEVARVVNDAQEAGRLPIPALVEHFRKPESTVKNWLHRARNAGMVTAPPKPNIRIVDPPPTPASRPPLDEIADTFREALTAGRKGIQTGRPGASTPSS